MLPAAAGSRNVPDTGTLGDIVARWPKYVDDEVNRPVFPNQAIAVLSGILAPQGAAIKLAAATKALCVH